MQDQLKTFSYGKSKVRVVMKNSQPWFVAKDVCDVLEIGDTHKAVDRLDDDERGRSLIPTLGGQQDMLTITESGLYSLTLGSRKPQARPFKRWVTHEVLPSIRKTGLYATPEAAEKLLNDPDFLIQALQELKAIREKNDALTKTVAVQDQQIAEMNPKATYYDIVLQTPDLLPIVKIAKDYGKSAQWMNDTLHLLGVQYRRGDTWLLYQQHAECGYTKSRTITYTDSKGMEHSKLHTYWTQKGRLFIYDLLKQHGHLPLIEQQQVG